MKNNKPIMLIVLDGWGLRLADKGNAIRQGNTPTFDKLVDEFESSILDASGNAVGLEEHQMGNSEVGHLNLGAGRIVKQDVSRIDDAIETNHFEDLFLSALGDSAKGKLHLIGLLGPGGVHAKDEHLKAILQLGKKNNLEIVLHIITDGRDTPPTSGLEYLKELEEFIEVEGINSSIASVSGRYYAMDRDKRWDRTQKAFDVLVERKGITAPSAVEAIESSYQEQITDEFIIPTVIDRDIDVSIQPGDSIFFYNFRADRMRQIVEAFSSESFSGFLRENLPSNLNILSMTNYEDEFEIKVLFPMEILSDTLAEVLSKNGLTQLHIAETEKYPHVTYFFNGREETPFEGEERILIPSPKVATYDLKPEMSANEITETVLDRLEKKQDDFILINFANTDMVGHTGIIDAVIKAVETVDECLGKIIDSVLAKDGIVLVTADHGNSEMMFDFSTNGPHTYHTTNPVPLFIIGNQKIVPHPRGKLADIAPTILELLDISPPASFTGKSLINFRV